MKQPPASLRAQPLFDRNGQIIKDKLYTSVQAAQVLEIAPSTLEQWRWEGRGPRVVKLGRPRYRGSDLLEFIEKLTRAA